MTLNVYLCDITLTNDAPSPAAPPSVDLPVEVVGSSSLVGDDTTVSEYLIDNPSTGAGQLIVIFYSPSDDTEADRITFPGGGWTTVYRPTGGAYRNQGQYYAWRISDGSEGSQISFYSELGNNRFASAAVAFANVKTSDPFGSSNFDVSTNSATASVDPSPVGYDYHVGVAAVFGGGTTTLNDADQLQNVEYSGSGTNVTLLVGAKFANTGFSWEFGSTKFYTGLRLAINRAAR